jgi:hypothetical protein
MTASIACDPLRMTGFRHDELEHAFAAVTDPRDWKGTISSQIPVAEREVVEHAVFWYTGTHPVFTAAPDHPEWLIVTALGHRLGPAGDHSDTSPWMRG